MKQLSLWSILAIWALLSVTGILFALWQGYSGRAFAATATSLALLLLVMLLFAARGVADRFTSTIGSSSGLLLGVLIFIFYIIYIVGTGTFALTRLVIVAALIFVPLALAMSGQRSSAGSWQDFLTIAAIWVFVKFGPSHYLFPYPGGRLAYISTVLLAVNVALATFLLARQTKGMGYSIGWGKNWALYVVGSFVLFAASPFPWAALCTSSSSLRSGITGALSWVYRWLYWSSPRGLKSSCSAACCKICWLVHLKAKLPDGGPPPSSSAFLTSPMAVFLTGATLSSPPSPDFSTPGPGAKPTPSSPRPWFTPPWTSPGTSSFAPSEFLPL